MAAKTSRAVYVDPRVARLREVSGHNGPWTSKEYEAAVGVIRPNNPPDPEPPAEVVELAEARDLALAEFERVNQKWMDAVRAERKAQEAGPVHMSLATGEYRTDPSVPRRLAKARQALDDVTDERETAADTLDRATVKWRTAETTWRRQLLADAYDRNRKR